MKKKLLAIILCVIMLLCLASCGKGNVYYNTKLISVMNKQEKVASLVI